METLCFCASGCGMSVFGSKVILFLETTVFRVLFSFWWWSLVHRPVLNSYEELINVNWRSLSNSQLIIYQWKFSLVRSCWKLQYIETSRRTENWTHAFTVLLMKIQVLWYVTHVSSQIVMFWRNVMPPISGLSSQNIWMEASRCSHKRTIILNSVRQHNHFIAQSNYKVTCFDYRLVIFRPIFVSWVTRCYAHFRVPSCLHPWMVVHAMRSQSVHSILWLHWQNRPEDD